MAPKVTCIHAAAPSSSLSSFRSRTHPLTRKIVSALCRDEGSGAGRNNAAATEANSRMVFLSSQYFDQARVAASEPTELTLSMLQAAMLMKCNRAP